MSVLSVAEETPGVEVGSLVGLLVEDPRDPNNFFQDIVPVSLCRFAVQKQNRIQPCKRHLSIHIQVIGVYSVLLYLFNNQRQPGII